MHSSPVKADLETINPQNREEWSERIYPHRNMQIRPRDMISKLSSGRDTDTTWLLHADGTLVRDYTAVSCEDYLNGISDRIHLHNSPQYRIKFALKGQKTPLNHPTRSTCCPDLVAYREYPNSNLTLDSLWWTHLEATGEIKSSKKTQYQSEAQAGAYTAYHLQARPDRVAVAGIWDDCEYFMIFFSDASRVYHTQIMMWSNLLAPRLLYAFVWSLYHPLVDESVTVNMDPLRPTFTVNVTPTQSYDGLIVSSAGEAIGCRTIVMTHEGDPNLAIKEQYIDRRRRFIEGELLEAIHDDGAFPGIVRLRMYEDVKNHGQDISVTFNDGVQETTRDKKRLVLEERGFPLSDVGTIRELLMNGYDLLEVTRLLYRKKKILHRDISAGNILLRTAPLPATVALNPALDDMCFSTHMLKKEKEGDDRSSGLITNILLSDFDSAEDQNPGSGSKDKHSIPRTGTPIFMARILRSLVYPPGDFVLPAIPDLNPDISSRFQELHPDRFEAFKDSKVEIIHVPENEKLIEGLLHQLRYEAESLYWYFVWWLILAQPETGSNQELIPAAVWSTLTDLADFRQDMFVFAPTFPKTALHSAYTMIIGLLDKMRRHLVVDLDMSKDKVKEDPEYLHEAFQRLILNFLVENDKQSFMDIKKSKKPRDVAKMASGGASTSKVMANPTGQKRSYQHMVDDSPSPDPQAVEDPNKKIHF